MGIGDVSIVVSGFKFNIHQGRNGSLTPSIRGPRLGDWSKLANLSDPTCSCPHQCFCLFFILERGGFVVPTWSLFEVPRLLGNCMALADVGCAIICRLPVLGKLVGTQLT